MTAHSYGLIAFRRTTTGFEVLVGHMGGPFWAKKHQRAWSFPKGQPEPDEEPLQTARREFGEEIGIAPPEDGFIDLGQVKQSGGKVVTAWAVECDVDLDEFTPGTFDLEWPPRSGRIQQFEEIDQIAWVSPDEARELLVAAQVAFVDRLALAASLDATPE